MRLVQHPKPDLALLQHRADGWRAQLLGRNQQDRRITHPHLFQRVMAFGQGQHAVHRDGRGNPRPREALHLIRHQRDKGRDHHRQRAGLVEPRQRRDLIADRFARAGGQDAQHGLSRHRLGHDTLLQGAAHLVHRFRAKGSKAEPAFQRPGRIVVFHAPAAGGVAAIGIAQVAHDQAGFAELQPHPGRHHRCATRHRNP